MGLEDTNLNVYLLRMYDGSIERVLEHLFTDME
jgi:hypothetical protein